jgi:hypothetical protein
MSVNYELFIMEIPKTLLTAILIGITVQITGCSKGDDDDNVKKLEDYAKKEAPNRNVNPCIACGMG